jgi:hypothetical protein
LAEPSRLLALSRADFTTLIERLPQIAARLAPIIRARIASQDGQPVIEPA